jgi:Aspartyl protease
LADRPLPWLYPYREDAQSTRLDGSVFRPFVPVSLAHDNQTTWPLTGLIDTGADSVLASNLLADQLGVDLDDHDGETTHAVGGRIVNARYKTVSLRLHPADAEEAEYVAWEAQVGFIEGWHSDGLVLLGSVGFLDRFTVTASRFAQAVAVEDRNVFDQRFGVVAA